MPKPRVLLQLDAATQPSVFDSIVAVDSGVDHLLRHGGVTIETVRDLVYGAMFTRGPKDLHNTAIFIGGSDSVAAEALLEQATACFFDPMRVSVMLDPNGANTTAAAAVIAASNHVSLSGANVLVLAATGPVGRRIVRLLAHEGANVRVASRKRDRAEAICKEVLTTVPNASLTPVEHSSESQLPSLLDGVTVLFSAGAAGVTLVPETMRLAASSLKVAIDLNAVPPLGIEGIEVHLKNEAQNSCACYGAIGVGGLKMKIHKAAVRKLFTANDLILDAEEIYKIAQGLGENSD